VIELFPPGFDFARLTWLVMALLLAAGAGWGFWRFRHDGRRAIAGLAIWALIIVCIVLAYDALS
jgi:ABC-type spermidine/putrescine transport system permease subunit II